MFPCDAFLHTALLPSYETLSLLLPCAGGGFFVYPDSKRFVYLCERRHSNLIELIREFKVSRRTIIRDLEVLSCSYPVFSTKGNGGGVHIADWFRLNKKYLTTQQTALLQKLSLNLEGEDLITMNEILSTFGQPVTG